jgi:hypothetical protein
MEFEDLSKLSKDLKSVWTSSIPEAPRRLSHHIQEGLLNIEEVNFQGTYQLGRKLCYETQRITNQK